MSSIRPYSSFVNAVAGPSRLGHTSAVAGRARLIQPGVTSGLPGRTPRFPHNRQIYSLLSPQYCRNPSAPHYKGGSGCPTISSHPPWPIRRYTTSQISSNHGISSTPSYPSLLAVAPIVASIPSDPINADTPTSFFDPIVSVLLSSPLPAGLTIILLTFFFRSAVTLPATIWQRRRIQKTKEIVRPAMKALNERMAGVVARECRAKGIDYEGYKKELKNQLATHQSALHKKHGTHPLPTMILPLFFHIPLLITLSLSIRRTVEAPMSSWAAESWWWLEHLGDTDPTMVLPVLGGVLAMMNAEVVGRRNKDLGDAVATDQSSGGEAVIGEGSPRGSTASAPPVAPVSPVSRAPTSPPARLPAHLTKKGSAQNPRNMSTNISSDSHSARKVRQTTPSPRPATPTPSRQRPTSVTATITPRPAKSSPSSHLQSIAPQAEQRKELDKSRLTSKLFTNAMRCGAVLFIPIAAQVPAALALYWSASMVFTLVQNLTLDWLDAKRKDDAKGSGEKEGIVPLRKSVV